MNTVTGVWNLIEARHDPQYGRGHRWGSRGLLMLAADAGFRGDRRHGTRG